MVFISQLPANTNLGASAAGKVGARSAWRADARPVYELAPNVVQQEMSAYAAGQAAASAIPSALVTAIDDVITPVAEATGLDHGALGVAAKVLGIPLSVALLLLLFIAWGMLRQVGAVPPLSKVIK